MTGPTPPWAEQLRGLADGIGGLLAGAGRAADGDHSAECRTCPVCTALAVLRGQRPDLSEALADVLSTAATALRGLARTAADGQVPDGDGVPRRDVAEPVVPEPEPAPAPVPVQHIEVA